MGILFDGIRYMCIHTGVRCMLPIGNSQWLHAQVVKQSHDV